MQRAGARAPVGILVAAALLSAGAGAYPLDGYDETKINRLLAYDRAREILLKRGSLPKGAFRGVEEVELRMLGLSFEWPESDPVFVEKIRKRLGADADRYGVAVLDLSDPFNPRYAGLNDGMLQNPGSVGKIAVALAFFQALADVYPDDYVARLRLLRTTEVTADAFIIRDTHVVPFWAPGESHVRYRPIAEGDTANLWTWLDWMCSHSSNAAASTMMKELLLLTHFGAEYPVSPEREKAFLEKTPKAKLSKLYLAAMLEPLRRNGIDPDKLRQGSFFTREGKRRVPGTNSLATARELVHYMLLLEQGRLVDPWSSVQIKRLLYLTDRRIRYASSPALRDSAVYYKSGSLYSCRQEKGFTCGKYQGNVRNFLNSVATVETSEEGRELHYIVAVVSNVLRKNSAVEHQTLGTRIHRIVQSLHPREDKPVVETVVVPDLDAAIGAAGQTLESPENPETP